MRFVAAVAISCVVSVHCDVDETALLQSKTNSYLIKEEGDCKSGKCTPGTKRPQVTIPPKDSCSGFECKPGFHLKKKGKKECSGSKCRHGECCKKPKPKPPVTPKPCICTKIYDPVCVGTTTYSNECVAKCAGQSDFLVGACQKPTKAPTTCAGFECKPGFKLKKKGKKECSGSKCRHGECCKKRKPKPPITPKPCICPQIYDPVCAGTNTYGNKCEAKCAGHSDFLVGACQTPPKVPTTTPEALTEPPTRPPPQVVPAPGCGQFGVEVKEDCTNKAMFEWKKGGSGYVAPSYNPSLYAEDENWKTFEIQGTSSPWKGTCVAYVKTGGQSCSQWCGSKGLNCVKAMDDAHTQTGPLSAWLLTGGYPKTDCTTNPSGHGRQSQENNGCDQEWATQMCACE